MTTPQSIVDQYSSWLSDGLANNSHLLQAALLNALSKAAQQGQGVNGGRIITPADGEVTGDFAYIDPLTDDVAISAITMKPEWSSPSVTRFIAVNPLPQKPIAISFTSITLSAGTAIVYNTVA